MKALGPIAQLLVVGSLTLNSAALGAPRGAPAADTQSAPAAATTAEPPIPAEYQQEERAGLRFAYHPSARDAVRPLLEQAESIRAEIRVALGAEVLRVVDIRVAWGATDLSRLGAPDTSGVRSPDAAARLAIDLEAVARAGSEPTLGLFRQELSMAGLGELGGARPLPVWLASGFGASFAGKPSLRERLGLGWALSRDRLIPVQGLDVALGRGGSDAALGAVQAADWVGFLRNRAGSDGFAELVRRLGMGESVGAAMQASFGASLNELEARWRADLGWRAVFVPLLLGGLCGAGLGLGLVAWWRRMRRRRALRREELARLHERARAEAQRPLPVAVRLVKIDPEETSLAAALHLRTREEHADPDVPKISHEGQWHTLH
jgi:hypothetical protein